MIALDTLDLTFAGHSQRVPLRNRRKPATIARNRMLSSDMVDYRVRRTGVARQLAAELRIDLCSEMSFVLCMRGGQVSKHFRIG